MSWLLDGPKFCHICSLQKSIVTPTQCAGTDLLTNGTVYVGMEWVCAPNVRLMNGTIPVKGKLVTLEAASTDIGVTSGSLASSSDGWVYFAAVVVHYAVAEGVYDFNIVLDGNVVYTFNRTVIWNPNVTGPAPAVLSRAFLAWFCRMEPSPGSVSRQLPLVNGKLPGLLPYLSVIRRGSQARRVGFESGQPH